MSVHLTGAPGMWSDFNQANKAAMMKSEVISWPVTMGILVLAFGSLVAAGLPLMLTIVGLVAAAGSLYLGTQLLDISIWAMNFALMFALALGIDYALFVVMRFRAAFFGSKLTAEEATAVTMDTAGKAVLFSGLTVLISLTAVMLVPSPAFRSMSLGIMLSVLFVLAATLTLLPAVLAKLGPRVNRFSLPWAHSGEHRSPRVRRVGRAPVAPAPRVRRDRGRAPRGARSPGAQPRHRDAVDQGRPQGRLLAPGVSAGAGRLRLRRPGRARARRPTEPGGARGRDRPTRPGHRPRDAHADRVGRPGAHPGDPAAGSVRAGRSARRWSACAPTSRQGTLVGGAVAENHDLESVAGGQDAARDRRRPGRSASCSCSSPFQAPIIAAVGVVTNLLATAAAFGVAQLIFQRGHLHGLLGFEPQGFLDGGAPCSSSR